MIGWLARFMSGTIRVMTGSKQRGLTVVERVTVPEAAKLLGISEGAVRQRMHRGLLQFEKEENGRVYVYLTPVDTPDNSVKTNDETVDTGLLDELRDRIRFLEGELEDRKEEARRRDEEARRKDAILMTLAQRVPELEAPHEPQESTVTDSESEAKDAVLPEPEKRSWWRRLF